MNGIAAKISQLPKTEEALVNLLVELSGSSIDNQELSDLISFMSAAMPSLKKQELNLYSTWIPHLYNIHTRPSTQTIPHTQ